MCMRIPNGINKSSRTSTIRPEQQSTIVRRWMERDTQHKIDTIYIPSHELLHTWLVLLSCCCCCCCYCWFHPFRVLCAMRTFVWTSNFSPERESGTENEKIIIIITMMMDGTHLHCVYSYIIRLYSSTVELFFFPSSSYSSSFCVTCNRTRTLNFIWVIVIVYILQEEVAAAAAAAVINCFEHCKYCVRVGMTERENIILKKAIGSHWCTRCLYVMCYAVRSIAEHLFIHSIIAGAGAAAAAAGCYTQSLYVCV